MGPIHIHRELQAITMRGFRGKLYGIVDEAITDGMVHVPGIPDHCSNIAAASGLSQRGFHIPIVMQPSRTKEQSNDLLGGRQRLRFCRNA